MRVKTTRLGPTPASQTVLPEFVLLIVGVLILLRTADPVIFGDGAHRYADLVGLWYGYMPSAKYSSIQPILALPAYWLAVAIGADPATVVAYFNIVLVLTLGTVCALLLARRAGPQVAIRASLLMLSASMLPHHLQGFFGEVLTALLLVLAVLTPPRMPLAKGILAGLAVVATPILVVPLAVAGVVSYVTRRRWWPLAGALAGAFGVVAEAWFRFGSLADSPYFSPGEHGFQTMLPYSGLPGFSYPVLFGVLSVVLSFGKGLVWFIPGLFAFGFADVRRWFDRSVAGLWAVATFAATMIAVYGAWWSWYGGYFWGPRFFLVLCFPAAVALAIATIRSTSWRARLFVSALLLASAWVGIDGYVFGQRGMELCYADDFRLESLCWYVPEFSALWRPFVTGAIWSGYADPRAIFGLWSFATALVLTWRTWGSPLHLTPASSAAEPLDDSSPTPRPSSPRGPASPTSTQVSSSSETDSDA